jgi:hypothetical protein
MDMEGETWRKTPRPRGSDYSIHQTQEGHLCVCTVRGRDMSTIAIWILEDYGDKWTLKHTISILEVFEKTTGIDFFIAVMLMSTTQWFTHNGI